MSRADVRTGTVLTSGRAGAMPDVFTYYRTTSGADGRPVLAILAPVWRDAHRAVYLVDDGRTVIPHYVAGWTADGGEVWTLPMPTDVDEHGAPLMRPDGRPVDFSSWQLAPRRALHVKVGADQ